MAGNPQQLLRERGVLVTAQRLAVLQAGGKFPHCSADDVANEVRLAIGTIFRQAVYDALSVLSEKGIIRRIQPAGAAALYEGSSGRQSPSPDLSRLWQDSRCRLPRWQEVLPDRG